eukprot:gb/GECG01010551.1/.p1 GENE.gb/GECG01010551.1/~~gb/GECG01010551.1/.p1  ORF type:complete len:182 (+),score=6.95 gb/GECG01010551.1/:1-546(+)
MWIVYGLNYDQATSGAALYEVQLGYSTWGVIQKLDECDNDRSTASKAGITCPVPRRKTHLWAQAVNHTNVAQGIEVFLFGGQKYNRNGQVEFLRDMWHWDSLTRQWARLDSLGVTSYMPTARSGAATWSCGSTHYLAGGFPEEPVNSRTRQLPLWEFQSSPPINWRPVDLITPSVATPTIY